MDPSRTPREYLWQAIDAESQSLEGSVRALRHCRNAFAPASSLLAEVVLTISSLLCAPGEFFVLDEKIDHQHSYVWPMSVTNGTRLHLISLSSGVTSISSPSIWLARSGYSLERRWCPYIRRQRSSLVAGTMLSLEHYEKYSRPMSTTYATLVLAQNPSILTRHSMDSLHLPQLLSTLCLPSRTEQ